MKSVVLFCLATWAVTSSDAVNCKTQIACLDKAVGDLVNGQIKHELQAQYTYLYLSQIFDQHTNHYPKIAKYLRAKSAEEMSHAERFMQYQNQRGGTVTLSDVSRYKEGSCRNVKTIMKAMECALKLEALVTSKLTKLHMDAQEVTLPALCADTTLDDFDLRMTQPLMLSCTVSGQGEKVVSARENNCVCSTITSGSYVELAELIAHEFLGHQVEDTKELADHYQTVKKLNSPLGDYLFDKHLEL